MGIDIELYKYDWDKLIASLLKLGISDKAKLEEILLYCGEKENNSYYLLNNEAWDEYNCFYAASSVIDQVFDVKDSFDIFLELRNYLDMSRDMYEFGKEFGIDLSEGDI